MNEQAIKDEEAPLKVTTLYRCLTCGNLRPAVSGLGVPFVRPKECTSCGTDLSGNEQRLEIIPASKTIPESAAPIHAELKGTIRNRNLLIDTLKSGNDALIESRNKLATENEQLVNRINAQDQILEDHKSLTAQAHARNALLQGIADKDRSKLEVERDKNTDLVTDLRARGGEICVLQSELRRFQLKLKESLGRVPEDDLDDPRMHAHDLELRAQDELAGMRAKLDLVAARTNAHHVRIGINHTTSISLDRRVRDLEEHAAAANGRIEELEQMMSRRNLDFDAVGKRLDCLEGQTT